MKTRLMGIARTVVAMLFFLTGCTWPPNREVLVYDEGRIVGQLHQKPVMFTSVAVTNLQSPMGQRTTIELSSDERLRLSEVTPEFLLARSYVLSEGSQRSSPPLRFEDNCTYAVVVEVTEGGPSYSFRVRNGAIEGMYAACIEGNRDQGSGLDGAPVFIDAIGDRWPLPLTRDQVENIWGPPSRVEKAFGGGF